MSDSEIFEQNEPISNEEVPEVPAVHAVEEPVTEKPKKKKRVLTPEQKEKLLDNLRRGREKSLATRRKNKLLKKAQRKEKEEENDALLAKTYLNKDQEEDKQVLKLKAEMDELRKKLKKQSIQEMPEPVVMEVKEVKRPPTPKPKVTHTDENPFKKESYVPKPKPVFSHGVTSFWDQFK